MKKILLFILLIPVIVNAKEEIYINENINNKLMDKNYNTYVKLSTNDEIKITSDENITSIYIIYELSGYKGKINYNNKEYKVGENNFIHEYIEIKENTKEVILKYEEDAIISDIYVYNSNEDNNIQKWEILEKEADLLLFSTHADDEQLFFLGLMPTYINKDKKIQVSYLASHNDNQKRIHEQLNGLWAIGVKYYPEFGVIPDKYSETLEGAIKNLENDGLSEEYVIKHQTKMIRKYKPLVVVGHDENGEYSHGQHILNTHTLKKAILKSKDENEYTDLELEPWDINKLYLHLYNENKIIMDYDTPLEKYNGKTAYEISKEGYKMHLSQQWTWFTKWINGSNNEYTKSTDIKKYSPNEFGLYYTTVGNDINKNDMFENVKERKKENILIDINNNINEKINNIKKESNNNYNYIYYILIPFILLTIIIIAKKKRK